MAYQGTFWDFMRGYDQPQGRPWYSHEVSNIEAAYATAKEIPFDQAMAEANSRGQFWIQAPASEFPEGQRHDSGLGDFGTLLTVAGIAAGGLGLIGALGEAGAAGAAGWVSAEGGIGYAGGMAADAVASSSILSSVQTAAQVARQGISVANGIASLTSGGQASPTASPLSTFTRSPTMNPLYVVQAPAGTGGDQQAPAPAAVGDSPPPPNAGAGTVSAFLSDSRVQLAGGALLLAAAVWAFWPRKEEGK